MTGRGAGFCAGYGQPGYMNGVPGVGRPGWGRGPGGWGRGCAGGRGWHTMLRGAEPPEWMGAGAPADVAFTRPQELATLKMRAEQLERSLENIQRRIKEVEADPTET